MEIKLLTKKPTNIIAIVGKGGVGKTTVAGLIVKRLIKHNCNPVLVIDADPNTGLDITLGLKIEKSIGTIREEAREVVRDGISTTISKQELLELKIAESIVERENFDFIAMGRPEGPGCYCYANNVLKNTLLKIAHEYPYVVIDNEAGLENLSRRIVQEINLLIIVSDPSQQGIKTVERLFQLSREMGIKYQQLGLVINRIRHESLSSEMYDLKNRIHANYLLGIQNDPEILEYSENGKDIWTLKENNDFELQIDKLLNEAKIFDAKKRYKTN